MTRPSAHGNAQQHEAASGIAHLEGYLICQTEVGNARAEAEAFACRMPWLTTAQHDEVVRLYTDERLELSRKVLRAVVDRCHALNSEYSARYATLRRRTMFACAAVLTTVAVLSTGVALVSAAP
ncbi:hypothetical protein [Streptomyces sp. 8N706]|uniref:hypothetical protein n=1 Tax=Streptomyces sp. 8N706 TaxID=3457416 RepID=UPI003FCF6BCB